FLLFALKNYYAAFVDKESNSKFYFSDNGILNLFLAKDDASLFENLVAISLNQK
ncbi:MAG TPA: ATPase, partial [Firmicutes bacterium]|nr:ATPase [Bacillota bacterium]